MNKELLKIINKEKFTSTRGKYRNNIQVVVDMK